jgi:predicted nuclease with TOPRIM domain
VSKLDETLQRIAEVEEENARLHEEIEELRAKVTELADPMEVECHLCLSDVPIHKAEQVYGMWLFECPKCFREMERLAPNGA